MLHSITVLVYFEGPFWVGLFERHDKDNSAVARHVFGSEPTDAELYQFVLTEYQLLHFSEPEQNIKLTIKRKNPKRISREVRRLMQKSASDVSMTRAQEAIKLEIEKNKKTAKIHNKAEKMAAAKRKFALKQAKKKRKQRGH